jgi:hypothetical protein
MMIFDRLLRLPLSASAGACCHWEYSLMSFNFLNFKETDFLHSERVARIAIGQGRIRGRLSLHI